MSLQTALEQLQAQIEIVDTPEPLTLVCGDCGNMGYIRYNVDIGHPRFGKMYPCPNPNCPAQAQHKLNQAQEVMRLRSKGWEADFADMTFESFRRLMGGKNHPNWKGKRGAYAMALAFAHASAPFDQQSASRWALKMDWPEAQPGESRSVVLTGDVGMGKTGLAVAAANDLMSRGCPVIFMRMRKLINYIQETYYEGWQGETSRTRLDIFINCPYLIIDEFEVENYSKDRLENVEEIIRGRADKPNALPFLLTTNLSQDELTARWGRRIGDVVKKAHYVPMYGVKMRQTNLTAKGDW